MFSVKFVLNGWVYIYGMCSKNSGVVCNSYSKIRPTFHTQLKTEHEISTAHKNLKAENIFLL